MELPRELIRLGVEEWKLQIAMRWANGDVSQAGSFAIEHAGQPDAKWRDLEKTLPVAGAPHAGAPTTPAAAPALRSTPSAPVRPRHAAGRGWE